jgi:adenylate cyclase
MVSGQLQPRPGAVRASSVGAARRTAWPTYFGIIALLVLIVIALAGGIIWYNLRKSTELMLAAAEREMVETGEKISDRMQLLYDPLYAIVGIASQVPEIKTPLADTGHPPMAMLLRVLRFYPQILSLYVGLENGDFFGVTHIAGESRTRFRDAFKAPENAAFAIKIITSGQNAERVEHWVFLDDDGVEVGRSDDMPPEFDPRQRPWYGPALHTDHVEASDLYIFVLNHEPGFTLSRSFRATIPGVFGADLTETDLSDFLSGQRITPGSLSFIFTRSGGIVAYPDHALLTALLRQSGRTVPALPQVSELQDPAAAGLFAEYRESGATGNFFYDVAGRSYIGRVVEIPARYGHDQLLGIAVPIDEIEEPVIAVRNQTLFYSIAFLTFALPLYVTLVVFWVDRRLGRSRSSLRPIEDE